MWELPLFTGERYASKSIPYYGPKGHPRNASRLPWGKRWWGAFSSFPWQYHSEFNTQFFVEQQIVSSFWVFIIIFLFFLFFNKYCHYKETYSVWFVVILDIFLQFQGNTNGILPYLGKWKGHSITKRSGVYGATIAEADTVSSLEINDKGQLIQVSYPHRQITSSWIRK